MHILFLSDNFPPEVNAPASRTFEHCREWVRAGHRVTVITCAPNFPTGKLYKGYKNRLWQQEHMDGIRVIRVWSYITVNTGFFRRILDYLSFMVSAVLAAPFVRRVDLVIGTSPQFFTACAAFLVSRYKRAPFIFELRDLWPESIKAVGAMGDSALMRILERLELFLYRKADLIISVTNAFKKILIGRGIEPEKIKIVTNGVDLSYFRPTPKDPELVRKLDLKDKFVAGYVGTHGMAHALETVLQAIALLQTEDTSGHLQFIFLGDGAKKQGLVQEAQRLGLDNVIFLDSVDKAQVARYWSLLDVSIIHLKKTKLFESVIPSKLFESMGMGIPVLLGVAGEAAAIVRTTGTGLVFEPEEPDQLMDKLLKLQKDPVLYEQLRDACRRSAGDYDRLMLAGKMLTLLKGAASVRSR